MESFFCGFSTVKRGSQLFPVSGYLDHPVDINRNLKRNSKNLLKLPNSWFKYDYTIFLNCSVTEIILELINKKQITDGLFFSTYLFL